MTVPTAQPFPSVAELLPHDPPMILIDEVCAWTEPIVRCRVKLREGSPFVRGGRAHAVVTLEYMAQTVGAYVGLWSRKRGEPIRIGYLLGARDVALEVDALDVGDEIIIEVQRVWGNDELGSFECKVERAGVPIASATLNVYRGDVDDDDERAEGER